MLDTMPGSTFDIECTRRLFDTHEWKARIRPQAEEESDWQMLNLQAWIDIKEEKKTLLNLKFRTNEISRFDGDLSQILYNWLCFIFATFTWYYFYIKTIKNE